MNPQPAITRATALNPQPAITSAAALIADPARTAMLLMLVDGRAHPAGELAYCAGVSAQTASSHLAKLLAGGLLSVEREGRHRYYRLAGPRVVSLLEHLASVGPGEPMRRRAPNPAVERLRFARCCYDHLAGRPGRRNYQGDAQPRLPRAGRWQGLHRPAGRCCMVRSLGTGCCQDHTGSPWHRVPVPRLDRA
jgi:DNA-binding transcriptional ArsR family regulator